MSLSASTEKNPIKVAAGEAGARARWGDERRIVRLDALTGDQRALVVALVQNMGTKKAAGASTSPAAQEVDRHDRDHHHQR